MVKSKKMSKTSIAVIVLALLLVLSMVMGITGAWFTDRKSDTSNSQNITFGKIELDGVTATFADAQNVATALPGDTLNFSAEVGLIAASENAFVLILPSTENVNLYVDEQHQNPAFDYAFAGYGTVTGWTEVANYAGEGKLYYVVKGSSAMSISGTVHIDEDLANVGYNQNGEEVRVNSVGGSYAINFGVEARAIQARNLSEKTAGWTAEEAAAIAGELTAQTPVARA